MTLLAKYYDGDPQRLVLLGAFCPACKSEHGFRIDAGSFPAQDVWEFDGNYEQPTFKGSMLSNPDQRVVNRPLCHSYLKNGEWRFLEDSTHDLAGRTVPMIPYPAIYKVEE